LVAVGLISVVVGLSVGAGGFGAVVIARHRAQAAADLSALAAAEAVPGGREAACARAGRIATAMHASLAQCGLEELDIVVTVDVRVVLQIPGLAQVGPVRSTARAGPAVSVR
jgi:secretion/DNA translocation related TadE-like protein